MSESQKISDDVARGLLLFYRDARNELLALEEAENIILDIDIGAMFNLIVYSYNIKTNDDVFLYLLETLHSFIKKYGDKFPDEFIKYLKEFSVAANNENQQ